jgi:NAD(P)-dependent dehydrogenase (short-subunit alcohol dehydrogenase family)
VSLSDKRILVIGGGSGIGFAVAEAAAGAGAQVTIASSNQDKVTAAAARIGNRTLGAQLDVTREDEVAAFFGKAQAFDHIAFTAGDWGGPRRGALTDIDLEKAKALFEVRFWGAVKVAKHAAKTMPAGGSLTLTDGMIAQRPQKGSAISTAMTGAVEHLTRALAVEFAPLRVNAVCPGLIHTGIWDRIPEDRRDKELAEMTSRQLLPRVGQPSEVAEAYLYLMRGGYTTGQVLYVEGGRALTG